MKLSFINSTYPPIILDFFKRYPMDTETKILIVEPNSTYAALLKRMLSAHLPDNLPGASKIVIAPDGESALEALRDDLYFDLVITELVFFEKDPFKAGRLDGCSLLGKIRSEYPGLRVITLTAWYSRLGEAVSARFDAVLFKSDAMTKIINSVFRAAFPV